VDLINRIRDVLAAEANDAQLDKYLDQLRDSYTITNRQFLRYQITIISSIVGYHLIVYGGGTLTSVAGVQLTDVSLLRKTFLIFPAALLAAAACVGYLRRIQRETYDFLTISRHRVLAKTGLHELRLPGDHILGAFMLRIEGGWLGKITSWIITFLFVIAFVVGPTAYVIGECIENVSVFGLRDLLCVTASGVAITLCICGIVVIYLSGLIKTTLPVVAGS
jgi:hypothetical protein